MKTDAKEIYVPIAKLDSERRLVYGIVMEPDALDSENDTTTAGEIEKAAHGFMLRAGRLDREHERLLEKSEAAIVENYIAPVDFELGGQDVPVGAWIMVTKIFSDLMWTAVKAGEITGYSIRGWGVRTPQEETE